MNKPATKLAILLHGYTGDLNTFSGKHKKNTFRKLL